MEQLGGGGGGQGCSALLPNGPSLIAESERTHLRSPPPTLSALSSCCLTAGCGPGVTALYLTGLFSSSGLKSQVERILKRKSSRAPSARLTDCVRRLVCVHSPNQPQPAGLQDCTACCGKSPLGRNQAGASHADPVVPQKTESAAEVRRLVISSVRVVTHAARGMKV